LEVKQCNEIEAFKTQTKKTLDEVQIVFLRQRENLFKKYNNLDNLLKSNHGLKHKVIIDLNKTPIINITWKIEKSLDGIKENTKKGHDFAARVFAIKKTGATPLSNRAINYVFSSNNDVGFNSPSPYTKKSIDNVLSTTKENLNQWVTVKRNVKEDFKKFHNLDVNELDGLAIMSDTDNSKKKSVAYYQNIFFSEN
jgi:hypothetical protein